MCVSAHLYSCACAHVDICSSCPESCRHQGSNLFTPHLCHSPDHWQLRRRLEPNVRPLSLPDDFAKGSDCLRWSFPRQASSSSNLHNNAFLPLMTHWAGLHNSHRHIASTLMSVHLCGVGASEPQNSNIDLSIIFYLLIRK